MKTLTRKQAIDELTRSFVELVDDEHSLCEVASRLGIYCGGFAQWTLEQLKERYDWIADRRPGIGRKELEGLANAWQLARQQVHDVPLPCHTQAREHDTCKGWDEWSNKDLARFYAEMNGETVEVLDDETSP